MPLPPVVLVTGIQSFPLQKLLTGTITSTGKAVVGVGTSFLTELLMNPNPGSNSNLLKYKYIFNSATGEIREIALLQSATKLQLKTAFAVNVAGAAFYVVDNYFLNSYSISPLGAGVIFYAPEIAGVVLDADTTINNMNDNGILFPFALDATAADAQVTQT